MAHYAKVNNGVVVKVIVAEQKFIDSLVDETPGEWVQTSYNTKGGVHVKGGTPLRKNFAGIGYTYDKKKDVFIPPKPYPSWVLNEETCLWEAPILEPDEKKRHWWNEDTKKWEKK